MNGPERPAELTPAYEALRAQATGEVPPATPGGLALFLAAGVPAWMKAWRSLAPAPARAPTDQVVPVPVGQEVARLLTEMALGGHRRSAR